MLQIPQNRAILAVDPGRITGYVLVGGGGVILEQDERYADDFLAWAESVFTMPAEKLTVVCEDFQVTQRTLKLARDSRWWSLEQIGVLRWWSHRLGCRFILQSPASALKLVTDARLEPFGLNKRGGKGHYRDASRHLVYHLVREYGAELAV